MNDIIGQTPRTARGGDAASQPAEWAVECVQFLIRTAARSGPSLALSHQILERTSRGELPPAAWQDALTALGRTQGETYARQWATLHARWLGGLLQAAAGAPPGSDPPAHTPDDPAGWCQQLADDAMRRMAEALDRRASHLAGVAAGVAPPRTSGAPSSPHQALGGMTRLVFDLLNDVADARARQQDTLLRSVLAAGAGWDLALPAVVELAAPTGEVASASLALTNMTPGRIAVRCLIPDVRRADGIGPAFAARLAAAPDRLILEPGETGGMRVSLALDAASYEPDAPYVGTLQVTRDPSAPLHVPLRIVATSRAGEAQPRPGAS